MYSVHVAQHLKQATDTLVLRMMSNQLSIIPNRTMSKNLFEQVGVDFFPSSLDNLAGKRVIFRHDFSKEAIVLRSMASERSVIPSNVKEFAASPRERVVAGIDSSCALVGETEDGSIYAGRVTTVYGSRYGIQTYCRQGPFIFYLDSKSLLAGGTVPREKVYAIVSESTIAERFIRILMERSAQIHAARSVSDALIVVDGALQRSSLELRQFSLHDLQRSCAEASNELVGFSKGSSVKDVSNAANLLGSIAKGSVYIDITEAVRAFSKRIGNNKVVAAKFSPTATVFRVDFSSNNAEAESQLLADLKYNDVRFRGYPETLRLAHHMSVFESSLISSIRSYLSTRYHLIQVPSDDLRATVLGKLV